MDAESAKLIAAGLMGFGMLGSAIGVGMIFNAFLQGVARNPAAAPKLFTNALIGAALAEGLGVMAFAVAAANLF